jgi:hypothetical protein
LPTSGKHSGKVPKPPEPIYRDEDETSKWMRRPPSNPVIEMKTKMVTVWLAALAIPVVTLTGAQIDTTSGPSIGGGGYDLGPFLYSWLLVIVAVVWSLGAVAAALLYRDRRSSRQALMLTAIGVITLALVLLLYGHNLS